MKDLDRIPESLNIFFQEIHPSQLDVMYDADTIIERTFRFGNRLELRWLFNCYGRQRIAAWIRGMREYRLPERHLLFLHLVLEIEAPIHQSRRKGIWPH